MATHKATSFLIDRAEFVLIKPAKPTPSETLSLSTIDNDPNLEIICQTIYVYKTCSTTNFSNGNSDHLQALPSKSKQDPVCLLKEAISNLLVHYYPLAGKLKRQSDDGKLCINCNGEGVPFLEATASCQLSSLDYLEGIDVEEAKQFVFDFFPSKSDDDNGYHPLLFQVTKFSCGGFTIGMGLSHSVCDGFGAAQVFRAMAELAGGKTEPTVKPVWKRERLVEEPSEDTLVVLPSMAKSPYLPASDILHHSFCVSSECLKRLKMSIVKECGKNIEELKESSFTTLEVLAAYVWRSRFRAFNLNPDGKTRLCLAVGLRHLLNPPLPVGYYGNAFVSANVTLIGKDLNEDPLCRVAKLIKESKKLASNSDYIKRHVGILEKLRELKLKIDVGSGATMVLTDWRQLALQEEVDFGWKGSVNMIPVPWNMFGFVDLCIFMPPPKLDSSMKGGVRVLVSLPRAAMPKFKEEMDALLLLGNDVVSC